MKTINCCVCANEFKLEDFGYLRLNSTSFKICEACINSSDPSDDFNQVKTIIASYLYGNEAKAYLLAAEEHFTGSE